MKIENKKIFVTGGAGFLGSHVVPILLQQNNEVIVFDDFSNGNMSHLANCSDDPHLKIIRGDIRNIEDIKKSFDGSQIIIHLAVLCLRQSLKEPQKVNDVVVNGTLNCLDVARENEVELFLNTSSTEVYGDALYVPIDERHTMRPTNPYAAAKVAQDMYVYSYGRTYGLPWATIRFTSMYGPNSYWRGYRAEVIPKMIIRAMNRQPLIIFGEGNQTRDFTFVEDSARALLAVAENPGCLNESVICCTSHETSVRQLAEMICEDFCLAPDEFIKKQEPRPGDVMRNVGDNSKLRDLVGFAPEITLAEGLSRTINWFNSLPLQPKELIAQETLRNWE
jgi:UDP-glucose 4-epimerase